MSQLPRSGRLLAIDYGQVRLGFAICDAGQTICSPYENYTRRNREADATHLQRIVAEERIVGILIGLPVHLSGEESQQSREARQFAQWIAELTSCPVQLVDERFSSSAADQLLNEAGLTARQRKQRRDMLAAQVILTSYFESSRQRRDPGPLDD